MESNLKGALPILASAFGQQFGVRVRIGGDTAWTNGDTIQIPVIDDPSLRDVVLGYLAHEAAHVRLTNFRAFGETEGVLRHLVNILEDVRIERGLYDHDYPGTKRTLGAVWDYSSSKGTPEDRVVEGNLAALFCNYMLSRVRQAQFNSPIAQPALDLLQAAVEKELPAGFFVRLDVLFDKHFDSMSSTRDAVVFAKALIEALKQAEEEQRQANQKEESQADSDAQQDGQDSSSDGSQSSDGADDQQSGDSEGQSGQSGESDDAEQDQSGDSGSNRDSNGSESDSSEESGEQDGSGQSSGDTQQPSDDSSERNGDGAGDGFKSVVEQILSETDLPEDMMASIAKDLSSQAEQESQETGSNKRYVDLNSQVGREITTESHRCDLGEESLRDGVLNSAKLRSQIVGLLQAQSRARHSHREYGSRFDSKRIARAMTGERRIWKHKEQKSMVDTSVHVLLDTSGSMGEDQVIANSATVSLALAISAIPKADVAVSIFPGVTAGVSPLIKRKAPVRPNLARFAVSSGGGTPMADAMFYAARELANVSKRNRKVLIVITDGAPNCGASVEYVNQLIASEVDVYAIGINSDAVRHYFENSQVISNVGQLQAALFGLAKQFLNVA
jgi:Mg-chelatase subunit ChlD|tara:strand:- start:7903 stop:9750 length:1848 start_codon:yes stop_codon:yes gene_type:complete